MSEILTLSTAPNCEFIDRTRLLYRTHFISSQMRYAGLFPFSSRSCHSDNRLNGAMKQLYSCRFDWCPCSASCSLDLRAPAGDAHPIQFRAVDLIVSDDEPVLRIMIDVIAWKHVVPACGIAVAVVGDEAAAALGAAFMMGDDDLKDQVIQALKSLDNNELASQIKQLQTMAGNNDAPEELRDACTEILRRLRDD